MLVFVICFLASVMEAVCGIGRGVIMKPVLDSFGVLDVTSVSFLSGCTVLATSAYAVLRGRMKGESGVEIRIGLPGRNCDE